MVSPPFMGNRFAAFCVSLWLFTGLSIAQNGRIVVGSKNFAENRLLGELFAQLIEARTDLHVTRKLGLAGTTVCFEALRKGDIDLYPEYTGTGLVVLMGEQPEGGPAPTLRRVRRSFLQHWDLWWLAPLGFENAYEVAIRREVADRENLRTLSDLAAVAPRLKAGFGYEFVSREDGLAGLEKTYGLQFAAVTTLQQALKYQAAGSGQVDVMDVYTTDAEVLVHDLVVLNDDRGFFPPYQAAPLARGETLKRHPEIGAVLGLLADSLDEPTMRELNFRLQERGESEAQVAAEALRRLGLVAASEETRQPSRARSGLLNYWWNARQMIMDRTLEHLGFSVFALLLGVILAVPLGLILERKRRLAEGVIRLVGLTQTLPSLALLAFMVPLLGVGVVPAMIALWIYALFPILRNTYIGVRDADPKAVEAATALGMTQAQILWQIRLPLAVPVIMAGVRTAAVITVGTATLAAFIGAGGLGQPIITGLQLADSALILAGAIPAALLAFLVDAALALLERRLHPPGIQPQ